MRERVEKIAISSDALILHLPQDKASPQRLHCHFFARLSSLSTMNRRGRRPDELFDHASPHDFDAERAVLACVLLDPGLHR
jgi:hypothetical protein